MSNITHASGSLLRPFFRDFFDVENFFGKPLFTRDVWQDGFPAVNISEENNHYNVELAVPGFKKEDFKINVDNDVITISAEGSSEDKKEEKNYSRREYRYAAFSRSFRLPDNVQDDAISASYTDGMLRLTLPKSAVEVKSSKEIQIS